ncbi:MAG: B12-binding domain-containing radical SAM protein, partial [Bacteroidales bacterium]|nr:B12-binding domain-containing radical SAM protein [Bacteroidales bacterium]
MNFVWLDINASWSHSSLALPALHAQLDSNTKKECNWQVVRGTIKSDIASIIEQIIQTQPTYIFATCWLFNNNYINEVLCRVNAICKPKGIFLGGPEFLGNNKEFLNARPYITAVFKGEGEEMFPA